MEKNMTTSEILSNIKGNGGFNNFRNWYKDEIALWVRANFPCTRYVAKKVAEQLA